MSTREIHAMGVLLSGTPGPRFSPLTQRPGGRMGHFRYGRAVVRKRDQRQFGPRPYVLGLEPHQDHWGEGFPFDIPAVRQLGALRLDRAVTLLAGENGSGKSTVVEAIAEAMGFAPEGGELERSGEPPGVPRAV
jgi:hypothetical protein